MHRHRNSVDERWACSHSLRGQLGEWIFTDCRKGSVARTVNLSRGRDSWLKFFFVALHFLVILIIWELIVVIHFMMDSSVDLLYANNKQFRAMYFRISWVGVALGFSKHQTFSHAATLNAV